MATSALDADLVLEGGGVKGIALVGAVSVLEERGYRIHKVAGTSAGSIVGALVAAGTSAGRLREIMADLDYRRFQDPPWYGRLGLPATIGEVLAHKGWCRGDYLRSWLGGMLAERDVRTFGQLRLDDPGADAALQSTAGRDYRFVAIASDVSHGRLVRLPWDYPERYRIDPDRTAVVDAVRASMAIPFFFVPARSADHVDGGQAWLVDGGMLSNFPVDVFDRTDGRTPRWPTLGIKLSARPGADRINSIRGVVTLSKAMLATMTGFHDRIHIDNPAVVARTIFVDTFGIKATDFGLSKGDAERLYESGRKAATKFLDGDGTRPGWDFQRYLAAFGRPAVAAAG